MLYINNKFYRKAFCRILPQKETRNLFDPTEVNVISMRNLFVWSMVLGLMLVGSVRVQAQEVDSSYWVQYAHPLNLEEGGSQSFAMLDTVVSSYKFFFTAEQHWRSINTQIQFSFLRYLHQQAGVRNLIVEGGYSYGYLLNEYVRTGDERLLDKIMKDVPVCPEDQKVLYRNIFQYNQGLVRPERIQVTGIDLEHSPELVLQTLNRMLPQEAPTRKISQKIKQLQDLHHSPIYDEAEVKKYFRSLSRHAERHAKDYAAYWGEDFPIFTMILDNTIHGFQFTWLRSALFQKSWQEREARMYGNFLTVKPRMKAGNYYAQFGALHTDIKQSQVWDFPSLAHRLNFQTSSPVRGEVLTISRYVRSMSDNYQKLGEYEALQDIVEKVDSRFDQSVVLFSLIGRDSPFLEMSKTFQFIMLIDEDLEEAQCD